MWKVNHVAQRERCGPGQTSCEMERATGQWHYPTPTDSSSPQSLSRHGLYGIIVNLSVVRFCSWDKIVRKPSRWHNFSAKSFHRHRVDS
jgi:hypothetical protein